MKKFILTLLLIMFTSISAEATSFVHYSNTGRPVSVSRGTFPARSTYRYGTNAAFSPGYRAARPRRMAACPHRGQRGDYRNRRPYRAAYVNKTSVANVEPSRFSKNYSIPARKSYSRGGMTYYN